MTIEPLRDVPGSSIDRDDAHGNRFVRLVFSNESAAHLVGIGARVRAALH